MDCADCDNLLSHCESLTFSTARVENSLDIAERLYDVAAVARFTAELQRLAARQQDAREALSHHRDAVHPILDRC